MNFDWLSRFTYFLQLEKQLKNGRELSLKLLPLPPLYQWTSPKKGKFIVYTYLLWIDSHSIVELWSEEWMMVLLHFQMLLYEYMFAVCICRPTIYLIYHSYIHLERLTESQSNNVYLCMFSSFHWFACALNCPPPFLISIWQWLNSLPNSEVDR